MRLVVFFALTFFISCKPIYEALAGVKKSKVETSSSQITWVRSNIDDKLSKCILTTDPQSFIENIDNKDISSVLDLSPIIVSSVGEFKIYRGCNSKECLKDISTFFKTYKNEHDSFNNNQALLKIKDSFKNSDTVYQKILRTIDGEKIDFSIFSEKNTIIFPFAKFFGNSLQVRELKNWIQDARANPNINWQILLLSIDKQEWWDDKWKKNISFGFN